MVSITKRLVEQKTLTEKLIFVPWVQIFFKEPFLHYLEFCLLQSIFVNWHFWGSKSGVPEWNAMLLASLSKVSNFIEGSPIWIFWRFMSPETEFNRFTVKSDAQTCNIQITTVVLHRMNHCKCYAMGILDRDSPLWCLGEFESLNAFHPNFFLKVIFPYPRLHDLRYHWRLSVVALLRYARKKRYFAFSDPQPNEWELQGFLGR